MCILLYVNYTSVTLILKWREYKEFGKRSEREPVPEAFESVFLELQETAGGSCQIEFIFRQRVHWYTLGGYFLALSISFCIFFTAKKTKELEESLAAWNCRVLCSSWDAFVNKILILFSLMVMISTQSQMATVIMDTKGGVMRWVLKDLSCVLCTAPEYIWEPRQTTCLLWASISPSGKRGSMNLYWTRKL